LVLLLSGGEAHAAWTVKRTVDAATGQASCYLESTSVAERSLRVDNHRASNMILAPWG